MNRRAFLWGAAAAAVGFPLAKYIKPRPVVTGREPVEYCDGRNDWIPLDPITSRSHDGWTHYAFIFDDSYIDGHLQVLSNAD